jgi:hypothetical protein|tara:strand:- start:2849 stop:3085 length:237 start_codon:yes stop_codon:yes gene_type:complete
METNKIVTILFAGQIRSVKLFSAKVYRKSTTIKQDFIFSALYRLLDSNKSYGFRRCINITKFTPRRDVKGEKTFLIGL